MDPRRAEQLLQAIETSSLEELRRALLKAAVRYAHMRAEWQLAPAAERAAMDLSRGKAHDALIDACNILSRNMATRNEDVAWRAALGNERKEIGDFACHLHALLGVRAT